MLSSVCNNLTMYIAKHNIYVRSSEFGPIEVDDDYFELARAQSVLSMVTAVSYYVDLFINLDIWLSSKKKMRKGRRPEDMFDNTVIVTIPAGIGADFEVELPLM